MNKSFTLIEILVVIVVIGILSAFVLVGMNSITESASIAKSKAFSNSLRNSLLTGLVSEWKLDGNANDSWGSNNGTWSGPAGSNTTANWRPESECVSGECLHFDGTDDYIGINKPDITNEITIEEWIYLTRTDGSQGSFGAFSSWNPASASFLIWHDPHGGINYARFRIQGETNYSTIINYTSTIINKWTHVAATYSQNQGKVSVYINGLRLTQVDFSENISYPVLNWRIGTYGGTSYFGGKIDEVKIYKEAVSGFKIKNNYFVGLNGLYKNNGITKIEYMQRMGKLKSNLVKHE